MINAATLPTAEVPRSPFSRASLENLLATATVLTAVQPIVDLESSECVGHELLARARSDSFGARIKSLSQRADSMGLAVELSRWLRQSDLAVHPLSRRGVDRHGRRNHRRDESLP